MNLLTVLFWIWVFAIAVRLIFLAFGSYPRARKPVTAREEVFGLVSAAVFAVWAAHSLGWWS